MKPCGDQARQAVWVGAPDKRISPENGCVFSGYFSPLLVAGDAISQLK